MKVWNLGEEPAAGSLILGRSDSGAKSGRVKAGSEVQLLPLSDSRSVESAVADLTNTYSRRDGLVQRSSGFRRQVVQQHAGANAVTNSTDGVATSTMTSDERENDKSTPPIPVTKRPEKGNLALAKSMKKVRLPSTRKEPRVGGVFASAKDCQWTVVTSDPALTAAGLPLADISAPFKSALIKPM